MVIAYIVTMPAIYRYKNNITESSYNTEYSKNWLYVTNSLDEVKLRLAEIQKQANELNNRDEDWKKMFKLAENSGQDEHWQKMSKAYHTQLLFNIIKSKIIVGEDFTTEVEELSKFSIDEKDPNFQVVKTYSLPTAGKLKVNELISHLYDDVAAKGSKHVATEGFISSVKHFFTNLFTVTKMDEHKLHASRNEITSIIVQLLLEGRIQAAYTVANKFNGVDESLTKIANELRPASEALNSLDKLNVMIGING
jgi:hypothetical protein